MYERAYAVTILFVKHSTHIENWISRGGKIYIQIAANIVALRNKEKKRKKLKYFKLIAKILIDKLNVLSLLLITLRVFAYSLNALEIRRRVENKR